MAKAESATKNTEGTMPREFSKNIGKHIHQLLNANLNLRSLRTVKNVIDLGAAPLAVFNILNLFDEYTPDGKVSIKKENLEKDHMFGYQYHDTSIKLFYDKTGPAADSFPKRIVIAKGTISDEKKDESSRSIVIDLANGTPVKVTDERILAISSNGKKKLEAIKDTFDLKTNKLIKIEYAEDSDFKNGSKITYKEQVQLESKSSFEKKYIEASEQFGYDPALVNIGKKEPQNMDINQKWGEYLTGFSPFTFEQYASLFLSGELTDNTNISIGLLRFLDINDPTDVQVRFIEDETGYPSSIRLSGKNGRVIELTAKEDRTIDTNLLDEPYQDKESQSGKRKLIIMVDKDTEKVSIDDHRLAITESMEGQSRYVQYCNHIYKEDSLDNLNNVYLLKPKVDPNAVSFTYSEMFNKQTEYVVGGFSLNIIQPDGSLNNALQLLNNPE